VRATAPHGNASDFIKSVSSDQHEILCHIAQLYTDGQFDCDPTYSTGQFYREGVPEPQLKFDLVPQAPDVVQADYRALPVDSASLGSLVFDPPYMHCEGKTSIIGQRFTDQDHTLGKPKPRYQRDLLAEYHAGLAEFYRVLRPGGVLVVKCQDLIESSRYVAQSCRIWELATRLGFEVVDKFVLVAPSRMVGHNHHDQQHSRRYDVTFWVFKKNPRAL
jgi:hypothetical protein